MSKIDVFSEISDPQWRGKWPKSTFFRVFSEFLRIFTRDFGAKMAFLIEKGAEARVLP